MKSNLNRNKQLQQGYIEDCGYRNLFDKLAPYYFIADIFTFGLSNYFRKNACKKLDLRDGCIVADIMCGTGNNIDYLVNSGIKNLTYCGIDFSSEMISRAKRKHSGILQFGFIEANIFAPFNLQADHIICTFGLKCIAPEAYHNFVQSILNMLKVDGTISILEFQMPSNKILQMMLNFYLKLLHPVTCLINSRISSAVPALRTSMSSTVNSERLISILESNNFEVAVERKLNNAILMIYGSHKRGI